MKIKFLLFVGLCFSVSSFSQNRTGIGNVSDYSGVPVPNAVVHISPSSNTSIVYEYVCDKNGNYSFDITSSDNIYLLNIFPSSQSLQFTHNDEEIALIPGDNGILFHKVGLTGTNGINFTVVDNEGNPVSNAKVMLYNTKRKWRTDSARLAKPVFTNSNGQVAVNSLLPGQYWFNIKKEYLTNRFTVKVITIDTTVVANVTVPVRDLSQKEFFMCGTCDNKTWITDSIVIFGISQPYDADSKLLSDATWFDSNGNHGFWWFNDDETKMTYNYDSTSNNGGGSTVEADLVELTETSFVGNLTMFGLPVTYYMSAEYDDINLSVTAQDTTIYLDSTGVATITPDDLFLEYNYCFTCNVTLSQTNFNVNDIGDNEVYVTLEDRCGNTAVDTMTVTVEALPPNAIDEASIPGIKVYPNPASSFVVAENDGERIESIKILNISGKILRQFPVGGNRISISTTDMAKGIYFVEIFSKKGVDIKKIIIK